MKNQITFLQFTASAVDYNQSSVIYDAKKYNELKAKLKESKKSLDFRKEETGKIPMDEVNSFIEILNKLFENLNSIEKFSRKHRYNIHVYTKIVLEYVSGKKLISDLTDEINFDHKNYRNKNFLKNYRLSLEEYISLKKEENKYILDAINEIKSKISEDVIKNFAEYKKLKESYDVSLKKYKKSKNEFSNFKFRDRIDIKDMDSLNKTIEEMNNQGWSVKQIEGILSGQTGQIFDGGYGYGFTEGIMILWEKKE